jgi:hypothetical protein
VIPVYPEIPELNSNQIEQITNVVFLPKKEIKNCDVIFVFGCPDPNIFKTVYDAHKMFPYKTIMLTGGYNPNAKNPQQNWDYGTTPEALVTYNEVVKLGIPKELLLFECESTNSFANVENAMKQYRFNEVESILFISNNSGAGRQYLTLKKYMLWVKDYIPFTYDNHIKGSYKMTRENWMLNKDSISYVCGAYLRIVLYWKAGWLPKPDFIVDDLDEYVGKFTL